MAELSFLGHHTSTQGMLLFNKKLTLLENTRAPSNVPLLAATRDHCSFSTPLQSSLGLAQHYFMFFPYLTAEVELLQRFSGKTLFIDDMPKVTKAPRTLLSSSQVLCPFDPTLSIIVSTNASVHGLGAVL